MELKNNYDYVIVGGGTAGLVLANRLSEDSDVSVLVLEAGQDRLNDPRVSIPGMAGASQRNPELAYRFETVPQKCLNGRTITEPQGKMLGGSSGINNQAFIAPDAQGIDAWETLGNKGWNWQTLEPYYQKVFTRAIPEKETRDGLGIGYLNDDEKEAARYNGPLQVSYSGSLETPLSKAWVDTFKNLGHSYETADPFKGKRIGGYANPSSVDANGATKKRSYAHSAYLDPITQRTNLTVQTGAHVQRILFEKESVNGELVAKSLDFAVDDEQKSVTISKEVILAAGALQSPKVLELSGVGDPHILKELDIEVLSPNKNVGANLQARLMTGISFEIQPGMGIETNDDLVRQLPAVLERAKDLYKQKKGLLSVGGLASYGSMPHTLTELPGQPKLEPLLRQASFGADQPDMQTILDIMRSPEQGTGAFWISPIQWPLRGQIVPGSYVTVGTNQSYAFSRGTVHIKSSDSSIHPEIDPNYLAHELDMELLARQVFWLQELAKTSPLADCFKPDGRRNHDLAYLKNIEDAKEYVRESATTEYHPCGSCAMLPRDKGGVVSPSLLVYDTKNVRVIDSSILPLITSSNLQPTVYAVAERAADIIRGRI